MPPVNALCPTTIKHMLWALLHRNNHHVNHNLTRSPSRSCAGNCTSPLSSAMKFSSPMLVLLSASSSSFWHVLSAVTGLSFDIVTVGAAVSMVAGNDGRLGSAWSPVGMKCLKPRSTSPSKPERLAIVHATSPKENPRVACRLSLWFNMEVASD